MSRSLGWCFTLNNYSEEEYIGVLAMDCQYVIVGKEVGERGTPHLQGFVQFKTLKGLKGVKKLLGTAHWEETKGSVDANVKYCSKDGKFEERGTRPMSQKEKGAEGKKSIAERWALAKKGRFEELAPESIKTYEYIYRKNLAVEDRSELTNIWLYGASGCGKSSKVRVDYPVFYTKPMSKWWDGYAGEDVVLLDDYDPSHSQFLSYFLKIWADHYVFNAEVKGGMLRVRPKVVVVTSQYSIDACFQDQETRDAIKRRFKEVCMTPDEQYAPMFNPPVNNPES